MCPTLHLDTRAKYPATNHFFYPSKLPKWTPRPPYPARWATASRNKKLKEVVAKRINKVRQVQEKKTFLKQNPRQRGMPKKVSFLHVFWGGF